MVPDLPCRGVSRSPTMRFSGRSVRMHRIVVCLLLVMWSSMAGACINTIGTDRTGQRFEPKWYTGDELVTLLTSRTTRDGDSGLDRQSLRLAKEVRAAPDIANRNDLAVNLIRQGETTAAIRSVSYTHLDVYKRQGRTVRSWWAPWRRRAVWRPVAQIKSPAGGGTGGAGNGTWGESYVPGPP